MAFVDRKDQCNRNADNRQNGGKTCQQQFLARNVPEEDSNRQGGEQQHANSYQTHIYDLTGCSGARGFLRVPCSSKVRRHRIYVYHFSLISFCPQLK